MKRNERMMWEAVNIKLAPQRKKSKKYTQGDSAPDDRHRGGEQEILAGK